MKNAQLKIDALLNALVERLADDMLGGEREPKPEHVARIRELIELSQLNNARVAIRGKPPGPQSKVPNITDEQLVNDLKKQRSPENFPRRGPRNGKRESAAPPVPPVEPETPPPEPLPS